jgi:hypothetical protein
MNEVSPPPLLPPPPPPLPSHYTPFPSTPVHDVGIKMQKQHRFMPLTEVSSHISYFHAFLYCYSDQQLLSLLHIFFFFLCLWSFGPKWLLGLQDNYALLCEDGSPIPSPKTWRTRVTLLDWHLAKSMLGCILILHTKQGAAFLLAECLYVYWIEYALFPEMVCSNLTKIIF